MKIVTKIIIISILIFIFIYLINLYIFNSNPYSIISKWNTYIKNMTDEQNNKTNKNLIIKTPNDEYGDIPPSLEYAIESNLLPARKLEKLISEKHDIILEEVKNLMNTGYEGIKMNEIDDVQGESFKKENGWKTIWIKFSHNYSGVSKYLPTLTEIVEEMGDDIYLLHVSVFKPHTHLQKHYGISKGVLRFHYGLDIPEGDTGMTIENIPWKWSNRQGYVFDDTLLHDSWNHTDENRLVIFADLPRDLGYYSFINKYVHNLIQKTKHLKEIQDKLSKQDIRID